MTTTARCSQKCEHRLLRASEQTADFHFPVENTDRAKPRYLFSPLTRATEVGLKLGMSRFHDARLGRLLALFVLP